jgi:hypothetical protein
MRASEMNDDTLDRLIHRHAELSELFDRKIPSTRRAPPVLLSTMSVGKAEDECLIALADRVLAAYEGTSFDQDPTVLSLRAALGQTITDFLDKEITAS